MQPTAPGVSQTLERVFREDYGRLFARLVRQTGDFGLAEDALQEAFADAWQQWPLHGLPANPSGWLATTAWRRAIDALRRARRRPADPLTEAGVTMDDAFDAAEEPWRREASDDLLRLVFTCCHPALSVDAQVALTLRTVGGLSTREIAGGLLVTEATLAQRLVRAKNKIKLAGVPFRVPEQDAWSGRLEAVLSVVYLIFNEGYAATEGEALVRTDLCAEALRLAGELVELLPHEPEVLALAALLHLQHSRRLVRTTPDGLPVLLEDQDRSRWDTQLIAQGLALLQRAISAGRPGPYLVQAAIAGVHAQAQTAAATDWPQIVALYDQLVRLRDTPVVRLNRAAAVAMARGPEAGLALMAAEGLGESLAGYRWYHSACAELLRRAGRPAEAAAAYRHALELTQSRPEHRFLTQRLRMLPAQ